jgi:diguanylate cyclase (GGDEF)-like protein
LLQTKENQHLIPPLQSFNALLKKKAPLEKLEPAFRHVKDAALQDHIDPQAEKDAKGEDGNAPAAKGAVSAKSLESTYLNKLKELHQEILINVRLNIDKNYLSDLLKIEKRIKSSENIEDYLAVRRDILLLIEEYSAHTVEEREQAATFFKQVSERLLEVESQIVQSLTTVEETHREGRQFDNEFQSQLSAISETANFSKNLNELRDAVLFRLEHIQSAFKKKRTSDVKRMNALKERVGLLKQNFSSLKKEVSSARQRADSLEQELLLDPLTGIYNRRAYDKHIKEELQRYHRYNHEFSMLLFDVDHFKRINDNYGHAIGDRCLKEIINRIRTILRESDFLARVGGEEFLVILPATAAEQAAAVAEKVRKAVEKTEFIHNNEIVPITISIGVTAVQNSDHTPALLFSRADKAMYEAKNSGRNRVVQLH